MTTKIAIITGHNGDIGASMVHTFSEAGYQTIGIDQYNSTTADHNICANLAELAKLDGADHEMLSEISSVIPSESIITLVNNAAVQIVLPFDQLETKDLRESLDINCIAPFVLVKSLMGLGHAKLQTVINISSIHQQLSKRNFLAYAVSKSALSGLTRSLSLDIGNQTRVCEIQPAAIETTMLKDGFSDNHEAIETLKAMHPSNSIGQPQDIANLALVIAEQPSAFINGASINVGGGISNRLYDPS